ncbi:alpha-amylase [Hymenobacter sp. BRD128]|uniref:alpha-amylase n=1 Tax=Hymenobacter sp. BRD128 TaxID=2675878 RepID=UPI001564E1A4|nr:alpha-amylase [Hymenobacter sp. BRD128]QKG56625.1 alpha-amylase [Hymenobacter sp. BRD128]
MYTPLPGTTRLAGAAALLFLAGCAKEAAAPSTAAPASLSTTSNASAVPGTMMQGFYWDVPQSTSGQTWWQVLSGQASELSQAGITAMWLPPAYKGAAGSNDDGYGVYDRYDLGEFNQKGSVATRYGTLAQLQSCISSLHGKGIQVYEDMVMNHFMGADAQESFTYNGTNYNVWTSFTYPARANKYSTYQWHYYNFNGAQQAPNNGWYQWNPWDFQPYNNGDAYDNLMGCEVRYADQNQVNETIKWGNWMTTTLGLDGYRVDAGKHMLTSFLNSWFDGVKSSRFAVSEVWFNSVSELQNYISATGGRTSLFDVPLHYTFKAMSDGNGSWDMRGLEFAGLTEADGVHSVSFVDNHDTDNSGGLYSPVVNLKMLAYAYILTREKGYPCVFYKDYYNYGLGAQIKTLNLIRQAHAYGAGFEYTSVDDADVYAYSRAGDASHTGLLVMLNDGSSNATKTISSPFKNATLTDLTGNNSSTITTDANGSASFPVNSRSYSVWVPKPTTSVTFNINYSNTVSGQNLYIVGSTGQLGSWNTANAIQLSGAAYPNWTVTIPLTTGIGVQYKYFRKDGSGSILWETDPNNSLTPSGTTQTVTDTWH